LLRPLPVAHPEQLVWIWANSPSRNLSFAFAAYSTYAEWKSGSQAFESMSAYSPGSATLLVGNEPERVDIMRINASFFPMLGVSPEPTLPLLLQKVEGSVRGRRQSVQAGPDELPLGLV